jgi:hypothetical protein
MNAAWAAYLGCPVFALVYCFKRFGVHEQKQNNFLATALHRVLPQTIPIKTYVFITLLRWALV